MSDPDKYNLPERPYTEYELVPVGEVPPGWRKSERFRWGYWGNELVMASRDDHFGGWWIQGRLYDGFTLDDMYSFRWGPWALEPCEPA